MRAGDLLSQGDMDGAGTWRLVLDTVKELEQTEPGGAVPLIPRPKRNNLRWILSCRVNNLPYPLSGLAKRIVL